MVDQLLKQLTKEWSFFFFFVFNLPVPDLVPTQKEREGERGRESAVVL